MQRREFITLLGFGVATWWCWCPFQIGGHVMAQSKGRDAVSLSDLNAGGFLASESKRVETVKEVQKQLLDTFEQLNRQQLTRGKQEMEFASEFAGEITSARSVPDVMNAYQNWISKRMALYMEDSRKLFDDSQRFLNTTMKLLSIGKESPST
jgi:DNA repair ATPase RecN